MLFSAPVRKSRWPPSQVAFRNPQHFAGPVFPTSRLCRHLRRQHRERDSVGSALRASQLGHQVGVQRTVIGAEARGERGQIKLAMMPARQACGADAITQGDALAEGAIGRAHTGSPCAYSAASGFTSLKPTGGRSGGGPAPVTRSGR